MVKDNENVKPEEAVEEATEDTAKKGAAASTENADANENEAEANADKNAKAADNSANADKNANANANTDAKADANADANADADADETDANADTDGKEGKGKKKFFEKKKSKEAALLEEMKDKHLRLMAEFENFRKRNEKEKDERYDLGVRSTVESILPVIDNFERAMMSIPEDIKDNPFVKGMEAIYKQFGETLTTIGVEPIDATNKEFDPNLHNAVMHVEDESLGENIVVEELQKGYMYKETVVRHSMVKVAN
ncbi:MAG: nucleotide exchange factor GrpE [Eubacterium sp.]|nr:nucleotide exchange factor GrpE [Eubacterium sp.]